MRQTSKIIVHAPNVHNGGGEVLLKSVIQALKDLDRIRMLVLDARFLAKNNLSTLPHRSFVGKLLDRYKAEVYLHKLAQKDDVVLCFGNLPPLFQNSAHVKVFLQNRILFPDFSLESYSPYVKLRVRMERLWFRNRLKVAEEIIVQSDSMKAEFVRHFGEIFSKKLTVAPFLPDEILQESTQVPKVSRPERFVYVASGETHKNHERLFDAWKILAEMSAYPELVVTLDTELEKPLVELADALNQKLGTRIRNLGRLSHNQVLELYKAPSTLIFPSYLESFGLPLYEAKRLGLPVVASELDFVRDVLDPEESFNPFSARSIAESVLRYLRIAKARREPLSPREFCRIL